MIVLSGYGDDFEKVGTIRLVNGKVKYDLPDSVAKVFGKPTGDPKEFMSMLIGRFALSSTIVLHKENGDNF